MSGPVAAAWLAIFALIAGPVAAQQVTVLAGEHPGFTRLSVAVGEAADWRIGRITGGYGLVLPGRSFDIGPAADRISRRRIAGLSGAEGRLDIALACDCHLTSFSFRDLWLVLDVNDGPPPPGAAHEVPLDRPAAPVPGRAGLPLLFAGAELPLVGARPLAPDPAPVAPEAAGQAQEIAFGLTAGILRGADQGLVALTEAGAQARAAGLAGRIAQQPGLAIHTGAEQPAPLADCPDPADFDLAFWAGAGGFSSEVAARRSSLAGAEGAGEAEAAEALARTLIAYGFGREALQVLALDGRDSRRRSMLRQMARLVDGPGADTIAPARCPGAAQLWRALAQEGVAGFSPDQRIAVESAFAQLPPALRAQLGPRIAGYFLAVGDSLGAGALLGQAVGADPPPAEFSRIAAATENAGGAPAAALRRLEGLARDSPRLDSAGIVALIDLAIAEEKPLDAATADLLRALRFESRGLPEETALIAAETRLLTAAGDHPAALALADEAQPIARMQILDAILRDLVARAPDAAFLAVALGPLPTPPGAGTANLMAERLISLGFPEEARVFLAGPAQGDDMAERRYLRAGVGVALGRADLVETALLGMTDDRAAALRTRAGLGQTLSEGGGDAPSSWRAGDWAALAGAEDPLLRAVGRAMLAGPEAGEAPPLAARAALIAEAEETRRLARQLLDRFDGRAEAAP